MYNKTLDKPFIHYAVSQIVTHNNTDYATLAIVQSDIFKKYVDKGTLDKNLHTIKDEVFNDIQKQVLGLVGKYSESFSISLALEFLTLLPDKWKKYISYLNKYSYRNICYIIAQMIDRGYEPSILDTYPGWESEGYNVRKGEEAIKIKFPYKKFYKNVYGEDEMYYTYGWKGLLFSIDQLVSVDTNLEQLNRNPINNRSFKDIYGENRGGNPFKSFQISCALKGLPFPSNGY